MSRSAAATPNASPTAPALQDALMALVASGVQIAQAAAAVAETDKRIVALVETQLPASMEAASVHEAHQTGLAIDRVDFALKAAAPRIATMAQAHERAARTVRRAAALIQRIEAGWPRGRGSDDRQTMARRQIARGVGERITEQADGERAERLFDDLYDRLEQFDFEDFDGAAAPPIAEVIATICRELGLAAAMVHPAAASTRPGAERPTITGPTPDG